MTQCSRFAPGLIYDIATAALVKSLIALAPKHPCVINLLCALSRTPVRSVLLECGVVSVIDGIDTADGDAGAKAMD